MYEKIMSYERCANCGHSEADHDETLGGGRCMYGGGGPAEFTCCCPEFYKLVNGEAVPLHVLREPRPARPASIGRSTRLKCSKCHRAVSGLQYKGGMWLCDACCKRMEAKH